MPLYFTTDIFQEKNRGREKIIFPFYITNGQNKSECHDFVSQTFLSHFTTDIFLKKTWHPLSKKLFLLLIPPLLSSVNQRPILSQISQKSFEDGGTSPVRCSKLPFLLSNGQNDAERHGSVITRAKKEAPATTTSALILHQLFEQILYIPLIVFNFLHQPTDTVRLIPLL